MFINLCCFLQEVAAEVVQKLQPRETSTLFIEVKSEDQYLDSPIFLSILFKLLGVINPQLSVSYMSKATFKSFNFYSSPPASMRAMKSSKLSNPSLSESNAAISISTSFIGSSPPIIPT
ncbi:hypothetical protein GYH30_043130 [Glycine max]|uniref:Uncharacterized protein n=1 Tax=Glycine soja TaxID=3848 RepID=A0A445GX06_GLYSO|nr:hypothetical protein GYH30_043130 [Glycine max]RZB65742.1 hypothetical protein D0Y65_041696 [Glycine soja]